MSSIAASKGNTSGWRQGLNGFSTGSMISRAIHLLWCEGELDKLALEVAGFLNVVSVPDGAPTPGSKEYTSKFDFLESAEQQARWDHTTYPRGR